MILPKLSQACCMYQHLTFKALKGPKMYSKQGLYNSSLAAKKKDKAIKNCKPHLSDSMKISATS